MRGITEERLREILKSAMTDHKQDILEYLIKYECKELNPWQPIETAPRDRRILLFNHVTIYIGGWYVSEYIKDGIWINELGDTTHPTHWQELPWNPA